jgi:hypothetical protein
MRGRSAIIPAVGVCLFLTIRLWTARTGGSAVYLVDLTGSGVLAVLTVALGWVLASRLTTDSDRRGLIATIVGLWGLAFGTFQVLAATHLTSALESSRLAAAGWTALCAAAAYAISRGSRPLPFVTRAISVAALFLLISEGIGPMTHALRSVRTETPRQVSRVDSIPSVFVIVLDKYSSGRWLSHSYGVDQTPFEQSLRNLGFVVPGAARANYAHTQIALASFLNWQYLDGSEPGSTAVTWADTRKLIADARAWHEFRSRGYRVVAFPTTFAPTRTFGNADFELRPPALRSSRLPMTWWSNSPVPVFAALACRVLPCSRSDTRPGATPYPVEPLEVLEWKLEALASLPDSAGPIFAFVHLLAPHEPYLFNANCSSREPWWPLTDQGEQFEPVGEAYGDQVRCLAPLLLKTVRTILERSRIRPVIVLQSDHGHGRIAVDPLRGFTLSSDELSRDQLGDRLGVFAAYTFPGAESVVREDISPVNVFPLILQSLFSEGPEQQPDRSYWSSYQDAFSFTEMPQELTRPTVGYKPAAAEISAVRGLGDFTR